MDCYLLQFMAFLVASLATWAAGLLLITLIQKIFKFIQDDKSPTFNVVLAFFMARRGFKVPVDGHDRYTNGYDTKSDGSEVFFTGVVIITVIELLAVFVYELPIAALIIALLVGGVFGARFITRIGKKVTLLESNK